MLQCCSIYSTLHAGGSRLLLSSTTAGVQVAAAAAVAAGREVLGSVLYCVALNHKQMSLYYAPAFFAFLLGRCMQRATLAKKVIVDKNGCIIR